MIKTWLLYVFTGGFLLGVFAYFLNEVDVFIGGLFFLIGLIFIYFFNKNSFRIIFLIFLMAFLFGICRSSLILKETRLSEYYDQKVLITGKVFSEPEIGSLKTRLKIKIHSVKTDHKVLFSKENLLISIPKYPEYQTGDLLEISGKLQKPENFDNENGIEFDYQNFLAKDKIFSLIYFADIKILEKNPSFNLAALLFKFKNDFLKKVSTILPSPQAELLGGLLLGVKRSLGAELESQFRKTGLIHIVVLSGYNITIIVIAVFKFLSFLPRIFKYLLGVIFVICFAIMVGSGATVIRASIMAIVAIIGKFSSREYDINRSLIFAGLLMVIHNPLIIFHDPSFQLSFIASLGLVNLSPYFTKLLFFITDKFGIREIVSSTISTQISVLPIILRMTGEISIVALPVNLIVLPLIPITMLLGFLTGILSFIYWPLGLFFGYLPNLFLNFELLIVKAAANFSFSTINVKAPSAFITFSFYFLITLFLLINHSAFLKKSLLFKK